MFLIPVGACVAALCAADFMTRYFPVTAHYRLNAPADLRIAHISDLHNRRFGREQRRLLEPLSAFRPDLILITGDLINKHAPHKNEAALTFVRAAGQLAPVFFCTGNHERDAEDFLDRLRENGVKILNDECVPFGENAEICGFSDRTEKEKHFRRAAVPPPDAAAAMRPDRYSILLVHRPELMEAGAARGADLILSGHVHGGFLPLPGNRGLISPDEGFFPRYARGLRRIGNSVGIISRGLGGFRLLNPPEIVLIELTKE